MSEILFYSLLGITIIITAVTIFNLISAPGLNKNSLADHSKKISVCIPARNEENNIEKILQDVLNQTYKNIEVYVLDDNSEDNTFRIVSSFVKHHRNLKLISGKPLPAGWTGKNWACHQLSQNAKGAILLFIDADVRVSPWAIESSLAYIDQYSLSMLSVFPAQRMKTFSEMLIVPVMDWILLSFLPLRLVYLSSWLSFVAANGQFVAITREAYNKIGGHKYVANMVVEDMELARNIKKNNLKMMTFVGYNGVQCRMYKNFHEAFSGFTKNFFPGFSTSCLIFTLMLILFNALYTLPFIISFFRYEFILIIVLIYFQRIFISLTNKQNLIINVVLHPVQMIIMTLVGINSMNKSVRGKLKWKGRQL